MLKKRESYASAHKACTRMNTPGNVRRSLHRMTLSMMPVRRQGKSGRHDDEDDDGDVDDDGAEAGAVGNEVQNDDFPFSLRVRKATRVGPSHAAQHCATKLL